MDVEIADAMFFNSFPEKPAFVVEFPDLNSQYLTSLPLHRHSKLVMGELIVWSLDGGKLIARQKRNENPAELVPMFWTKASAGQVFAYEFLDPDSAVELGVDAARISAEAVSALLAGEVPDGFGVSSLWPTYARYLEKLTHPNRFLDAQEQQVAIFMQTPEMQALAERMHRGDFIEPPIKCEGFKVAAFDKRVSFVEMDVGSEAHLLVVSQDFVNATDGTVPDFTLCAGGFWKGHAVER